MLVAAAGLVIVTIWLARQRISGERTIQRVVPPAEHAVAAPALVQRPDVTIPAPAASEETTAVAGDVAPSDRALLIEPIAAFDDWFTAFYRHEQPSLAAGVELARRRRAALKELIALDPHEALTRAVPRTLRSELPDEIQAELETPIDAFGRFEVRALCFGPNETIERFAVVDGQRYETHTYGRRLAALTKNRLAIHGVAIDDRLALAEESYRVLEPGERPPDETAGAGLLVAFGDGVRAFASPDELAAWQQSVALAEAAPGSDLHTVANGVRAIPTGWTVGEKRVLWIRVDYPNAPGEPATDAELLAAATLVNQFFEENSRGRCSMKSTFFPGTIRLPMNSDATCNPDIEAINLAHSYDIGQGGHGTYDPYRYDRWIVVSGELPKLGLLGFGFLGEAGVVTNAAGVHLGVVAAHELGHNHGLLHSHAWAANVDAPVREENHVEYGDPFDTMGSARGDDTDFLNAHFNTTYKATLGYLDDSDSVDVDRTGVYRLYRHDAKEASGVQALRIANGAYEYWLEHRQLSPKSEPRYLLDRLRSGVLLRWGRHPSYLPGAGAYLIDASPGAGANFDDAPLAIGETFRDPERCVSVTPIALGGSSPHEWIDVQVAFGATGSNHNPNLSVNEIPRVLPARRDLSFRATAVDPDGDPVTCAWTFDSDHVPSRGLDSSFRFLLGGNTIISCSATDGRGGIATQKKNVIVDDPLSTWKVQEAGAHLEAVIHDGSQFVAAGFAIATSPDGIVWTMHAKPGTAYGLAHGAGRYVAVGTLTTGVYPALTTKGAIFTSKDLVAWEAAAVPEPTPHLWSVAFGAQRFVAVGREGVLLESTNGLTWQKVACGVTRDFKHVRFAMGRFVASGSYGTVLTSTDGLNWQNRSVPLPDEMILAVHRSQWLALATTRTYISSDGINWLPHPLNTSVYGMWLTSLDDEVLITGSDSNEISISEDGITWGSFQFAPAIDKYSGINAACSAPDGTVVGVGRGGPHGINGVIIRSSLNSQLSVPPAITAAPENRSVHPGESVTFSVTAEGSYLTYRWHRNGIQLAGTDDPQLSLHNIQPADAGLYSATVSNAVNISTDATPAIAGVSLTNKLWGAANEIQEGITHPNGRVYDQVLLTGAAAAVTADHAADEITRTSFIDLDDDIVQVEFSGPGTLTMVLDGATAPAPPVNYNQNDIAYVKGHAGIVITGADERTNVSVFSVGRITALNQSLFRPGVPYDGVADLAFIAISSRNGRFGGLRTANAHYFADKGYTGVYAPGVTFDGPLYVGDITAFGAAKPVLVTGSVGDARITGGDLYQENGVALQISGVAQLKFTSGSDSHGTQLPAKSNRAVLVEDGADVTASIVVDP